MHRASIAPATRAARRALRGRVPVWIPPVVCVGLAWWAMAFVAADAPQAGYTTVHPAQAALRLDKPCDPRWNQHLQAALAKLPPADVEDRGALERIGDEIALLPFVEEVGEVRILWPDSLDIPLRLKTPVACVRVRKELLTVAEDGTLLPGAHDMPPMDDHGFLPVLGPNGSTLDRLVPGDKLPPGAHLDALSLARAFRTELDPEASLLLGPILVDASEASRGGLDHPGVVLRLEERRTVWFGRLPGASSGETPLKIKVDNLERAARLLRPAAGGGAAGGAAGDKPWLFLDLRWDHPDIQYRDEPGKDEAQGGGKSGAGAPRRP
jgi:hypothetical protein